MTLARCYLQWVMVFYSSMGSLGLGCFLGGKDGHLPLQLFIPLVPLCNVNQWWGIWVTLWNMP